uniref:(California timema) hypothetical protein n=1 Tax=Timema californicum TaxID=61474 RepID=A0A7R9JKI3_TIMCA|nr:unnamed protein product [Timema californicum]
MMRAVGDFAGVSHASACVIINRVTRSIASLRQRYIRFQETEDGIRELKRCFHTIARFPKVVGALDCTHVKIQSPGGPNSENFRNRKGYFSLNIQTISSPRLEILDIVARWPGASHDSTIFNASSICRKFEDAQMRNCFLLGDGGYEVRSYLLTPLAAPTTVAEQLYNESQIRTRNVAERTYGVWKRRFPILSLGMRVHVQLAQNIIVATAVLHNIACQNREDVPPQDPEVHVDPEDLGGGVPQHAPRQGRNDTMRRYLLEHYFGRMQ